MSFIDRETELGLLEERWRSGEAELVVVCGRRRVGKTELLLRFCREKPSLYFLAAQVTRAEHLRQLGDALRAAFPDPALEQWTLTSWEGALRYLAQLANEQRLAVIFDEFPYLCEAEPSLPSLLQQFWDTEGRRSQLFLVLCGSQMSTMEREVLAHRTPLYGRRTGQLRVVPMGVQAAGLFLPDYSPADKVGAYGVVGGMPGYLRRFDPERSLRQNVLREILHPQGFLYQEPGFLLRMELRDPRTYMALLGAIASGCTRLNEAAQRSGLTVHTASKYLAVLQELGVVQREVSALERAPGRTKKGRYKISDQFLRFWFRFVQPNVSLIEAEGGATVYDRLVHPELDTYVGHVFEEICRDSVLRFGQALLGVPVRRVGRHWGPNGDLDVVAELLDGTYSVGECKWTARPLGRRTLEELRERAAMLGDLPLRSFLLFSRTGFTQKLLDEAARSGIPVVTIGMDEIMAP